MGGMLLGTMVQKVHVVPLYFKSISESYGGGVLLRERWCQPFLPQPPYHYFIFFLVSPWDSPWVRFIKHLSVSMEVQVSDFLFI